MSNKKVDFVNSRLDGIPEISLRGDIGGYDGEWIANRIASAQNEDGTPAKHVRIVVNSYGGNVNSGLTIITAMQLFKDNGGIVETLNEGCADSTAGWVFSAGTKGYRKVMQFATEFTHPPMFEDGRTLTDVAQGSPEHEALNEAFDKIINIFVPITGRSYAEVRNMMMAEEDLNADKAINLGFADVKINVSNAPKLKNGISKQEICNTTANLEYEIIEETTNINSPRKDKNSNRDMKKVATMLNLNTEASEGAIEAEVKKIVDKNTDLKGEIQDLSTKLDQQTAEVVRLKQEIEEAKTAEIENYVDSVIKADKTKEDQRDNLINMAKVGGLEAFKAAVPVAGVVNGAQIGDGIEEEGNESKDEKLKTDAEKFKNMSQVEKTKMMNENRKEFTNLAAAYDTYFSKPQTV